MGKVIELFPTENKVLVLIAAFVAQRYGLKQYCNEAVSQAKERKLLIELSFCTVLSEVEIIRQGLRCRRYRAVWVFGPNTNDYAELLCSFAQDYGVPVEIYAPEESAAAVDYAKYASSKSRALVVV